ncbi:hypothetical protein BDU57DRAFT_537831 [Ampelomyces quisqualis]|uniref:Enoyl reductase (ER) domain-containing protein n=1 Tax=Ampelomyces quisqualis TaxID=50730 RepID=A0A6A5QTY1_AMPQU|nr:hypothetical protein BDU57DRAFT_537831 [Ampelomyces quisqualis]
MRAYTHTRPGPASSVLLQSTQPIPKLNLPTQTLIRISHCALNPGASILMHLLPFSFRASPAIPELDFSGTIIEVGPSVPVARALVPGTKVFGSIPVGRHVSRRCGALAQYVLVEHTAVAGAPDTDMISPSGLAGLGVAGATALVLLSAATVEDGDKVLVNGAGGGIGHLVLQMCCERVGAGGRVVAIASGRHEVWLSGVEQRCRFIRHDGRDLVANLKEEVKNERFDVVVDAAGIQALFHASPEFLKDDGVYVSVGPRARSYTYLGMLGTIGSMASNILWPRSLGGTPRRYVQVAAASSLDSLEALANLVKEKTLKVHVGLCVGWDEVSNAYEQLLGRHAGGKIVVEIPDEEE